MLVIIAIICVTAILSLLIIPQKKTHKDLGNGVSIGSDEQNNKKEIDYSTYYTVVNCIQKYVTYSSADLNEKSTVSEDGYVHNTTAEDLGITNQETKVNMVSQMLEQDYMEKQGIKINLDNFLLKFLPKKIIGTTKENISKYAVYGELVEMSTFRKVRNQYYLVTLDEANSTFSIVPMEDKKYQTVEDIPLEITIEKIEKNSMNNYVPTNIEQTDMIAKYFTDYKEMAMFRTQDAYELLNEEYRVARFGTKEEYVKYIQQKKEEIANITPTKYKIDETEEYTQYTILDQNENYYIFRETGVMEYRVILDTYTIDLPEFLEKYNTASEQEKVAMNINKFIEAINAKDYTYAYSKIADSFKENYFKTQKSFEDYIKTHFYERNTITFNNFKNQANTYIYTTIITDKATNQRKEQNFIVRLKEGTDFEMSFEV